MRLAISSFGLLDIVSIVDVSRFSRLPSVIGLVGFSLDTKLAGIAFGLLKQVL
jgi:hypothetical protein